MPTAKYQTSLCSLTRFFAWHSLGSQESKASHIDSDQEATSPQTYDMSHIMRKPLYACEQKGRRCAARSLISTSVFRCLDSIVPILSKSKISSLYLASVAAQAGLSDRKAWKQVFSWCGSCELEHVTTYKVSWFCRLICALFFSSDILNKQLTYPLYIP